MPDRDLHEPLDLGQAVLVAGHAGMRWRPEWPPPTGQATAGTTPRDLPEVCAPLPPGADGKAER